MAKSKRSANKAPSFFEKQFAPKVKAVKISNKQFNKLPQLSDLKREEAAKRLEESGLMKKKWGTNVSNPNDNNKGRNRKSPDTRSSRSFDEKSKRGFGADDKRTLYESKGRSFESNQDKPRRSFQSESKRTPYESKGKGNFESGNKKAKRHYESYDNRNQPIVAEQMPLNKFISKCGICSRREAVEIIKEGRVKVNGALITEPAFKVVEKDKVKLDGKPLMYQGALIYLLLNKPKDFITTLSDEKGRKTVLDLVKNACSERIHPIGRLDRNTTGLLLFTNDGDLTQKMSHPKYKVKKIYQVGLNKDLTKGDYEAILKGLELEDGIAAVDELAFTDPADKSKVGIQIHSGKNRIVRRIFESLGYVVKTLDRVIYANLDKKNLPRGKWRFLSETEVKYLKFYNSAKK